MKKITNISNRLLRMRLNVDSAGFYLAEGASIEVANKDIDSFGEEVLKNFSPYISIEVLHVTEDESTQKINQQQAEEYAFFEKLKQYTTVEQLKKEFGEYVTNKNIKDIKKLQEHIVTNFFKED